MVYLVVHSKRLAIILSNQFLKTFGANTKDLSLISCGKFLCPAKVAPPLSEIWGWAPKKLSVSKSEVRAVGKWSKTLIGANGCLAEAITAVTPLCNTVESLFIFICLTYLLLSVCKREQTAWNVMGRWSQKPNWYHLLRSVHLIEHNIAFCKYWDHYISSV